MGIILIPAWQFPMICGKVLALNQSNLTGIGCQESSKPGWTKDHADGLTAAAKIRPIKFQNQLAVPIRSLTFWPVDGRPHPISGSMQRIPILVQEQIDTCLKCVWVVFALTKVWGYETHEPLWLPGVPVNQDEVVR